MKPLKQKRCQVCREQFTPKRIGLRLTKCCLNAACVIDYAQGLRAKDFDKQTKVMKKEHYQKDLRWQHKQCQPIFNKLRRLQEFKWFKDNNLEPTCISCGKPLGGDIWANGHYKSVGASSYLRYDLQNSYLQHNRRCNRALAGNISGTATTHGYKQGLINRFGEVKANEIMGYCERFSSVVHRFEWQDLERMRKEWNKEIRELEKYLSA